MAFQNAAIRKTLYDNCMIEQETQEYIDTQYANALAAEQASLDARRQEFEQECYTIILDWCNSGTGDSNLDPTTDNITLQILDQVSSDWANTQESSLITAGYTVERVLNCFKISLPE
jgi:hypothetical protein